MNIPDHPLTAFFRAMGHRTWSRLGALWIDAGRFSLVTIPCNVVVHASRSDIRRLLVEAGRMVAVASVAGSRGVASSDFWVRDRGYSLASLQRQFRQQVVRQEQACTVRTIPWSELCTSGLRVNQDTMERRGLKMHRCTTAQGWGEICAAAAATPGLEATGCFVGADLATFLVSWTVDQSCFGLLMHRDSRFHSTGAANAMVYEFTRTMLARPGVCAVTLGRGWFPAEPTIDRFKRHAGYIEEPLELAVALHPRWEHLLQAPLLHAAVRATDAITGHRLRLGADLEVLRAAASTMFTDGPDRPPENRPLAHR